MHNRVISVVGLGYVGLPVAVAFGTKNYCIAFDINQNRIESLINNIDLTGEVSREELKNANILFTNNPDELKKSNFFIVAVPTPIDRANRPDLTPLENVSVTIGCILKHGDIVVYESTVYPGVTEEFCVPILEKKSGLKCGRDFTVGYSPERINPSDKTRRFTDIIKVISGQDKETLDIIDNVYSSVVKAGVHRVSNIKIAEAAKVIENTQRDLNIALMNELAVIFDRMNIDTTEVLQAAGTKWNFLPFRPGFVGGHCIGVDPYYLTYKAELMGYIPQIILAGRRINDNMSRFVARKGIKLLIQNNHNMINVKANILGVTFKENCPDIRNSKVIDMINELLDFRVEVSIYDSVVNKDEAKSQFNITLNEWDNLPVAELLIVAVGHNEFKNITLNKLLSKVKNGGVIIDAKSILPKDEILKMGYKFWRL